MNDFVWTKKSKILIIIFGILAIVLLFIRFFSTGNDSSKVYIVKSSSKFYTVSGCVNRYLNYLYNEDIDNLIILLDDSFIKDNNVSKKNLFDKISKLDGKYTFEARKMYEQVLSKNVTKYYIKGYLVKEGINSNINDKIDYYLIIILDVNNSTYSVIPYDGDIFINGDVK